MKVTLIPMWSSNIRLIKKLLSLNLFCTFHPAAPGSYQLFLLKLLRLSALRRVCSDPQTPKTTKQRTIGRAIVNHQTSAYKAAILSENKNGNNFLGFKILRICRRKIVKLGSKVAEVARFFILSSSLLFQCFKSTFKFLNKSRLRCAAIFCSSGQSMYYKVMKLTLSDSWDDDESIDVNLA